MGTNLKTSHLGGGFNGKRPPTPAESAGLPVDRVDDHEAVRPSVGEGHRGGGATIEIISPEGDQVVGGALGEVDGPRGRAGRMVDPDFRVGGSIGVGDEREEDLVAARLR
jgi:hypothetical protein